MSQSKDGKSLAMGSAGHGTRPLPESFVPSEWDVVSGRGRKVYKLVGNERFRCLVALRLQEYLKTTTKLEKTFILGNVMAQVRANSPEGGFVKKCNKSGRWYEGM
jgi:hypothetical protein